MGDAFDRSGKPALVATAKAKFADASWTFVATERLSEAMFAANAVTITSLKMLAAAIVSRKNPAVTTSGIPWSLHPATTSSWWVVS